jgi:hypothetical protein
MENMNAAYFLARFEQRLKDPRTANSEMGEWYRQQISMLKKKLESGKAATTQAPFKAPLSIT